MKVAGFTFIRNAIQYDYPIVEAITSVLPLCHEFVVAVGNSDDDTLNLIKSINSDKIKIIQTVWDDSIREGGRVLALETDRAFAAISPDADWAFYIQGDEVLHEQYRDTVYQAMLTYKEVKEVEGLLFKYLHFYGSYDYVADSRRWYRREIRVVRNDKNITSYKDAQGFRKKDGAKLHVKLVDAYIYHYGWVKHPAYQQKKQETFNKHWHDDSWMEKYIPKAAMFDYSGIDSLTLFTGTHPQVMQPRIVRVNWKFEHDISKKNISAKNRLLQLIEKYTGWRIGEYRNYKLL